MNAHAQQLIWRAGAPQANVNLRRCGSDTPRYAVFSRDFCEVYSHHDAVPNHQLGRYIPLTTNAMHDSPIL